MSEHHSNNGNRQDELGRIQALNQQPKTSQLGSETYQAYIDQDSRTLKVDIDENYFHDTYPQADHILIVYFPQVAEPTVFADQDSIVIGRTAGTTVDLDTTPYEGRLLGVSRVHADIRYEQGTYYLTDLKSTNGTWVNNNRLKALERYALQSGDQVRLGQCLFAVFMK